MQKVVDQVTVIIQTCDRADFLRDALESVERQTARERIGQVLVSENSLSDASQAVCDAFPNIPIQYFRQRPPVPALLHLKAIWRHVRCPIVAILHDDDWWGAQHIEDATAALDSDSDCSAVFCSFFETKAFNCPAQVQMEKAWRIWACSGRDFSKATLVFDEITARLICLLDSNLHYSTMVARVKPFWESYLRILEVGNTYDYDRLAPIFLSDHGSIKYLTKPSVFVRVHPGQDGQRSELFENGWHLKAETTRMLIRDEPEMMARAVAQFNQATTELSAEMLVRLLQDIGEPQLRALTYDCGLALASAALIPVQPQPRKNVKWIVKQICPPAIITLTRRIANGIRHA